MKWKRKKLPASAETSETGGVATGADRRTEPRTTVSGEAEILIASRDGVGRKPLAVGLHDVSPHGIGIISPVDLPRGEEFVVPRPLALPNADAIVGERGAGRAFKVMHSKPAPKGKYFIGARAVLESLETREMMSVSHDPQGWTVVNPASDSQTIYVSNSQGSDSNTGLSAASPVKSIARGSSLVRDGSADQLLLKRGDTWHESFGIWTKSGRSTSEPLVISTYGAGARPVLATGTATGITTGARSDTSVSHLSMIGLNFWSDGRDPSRAGYNAKSSAMGMQLIASGGDILIEDCKVQGYENNIAATDLLGPVSNITIRRSEILDSYSASGAHSQGLFVDGVQHLSLEGNTFDHNGWNTSVSGASPTIFNHNAYLTARTTDVSAVGNIFANASSHGLQARSGGYIHGNIFIDNPIGLTFGLVNGGGHVTEGGVTGEVTDNVFLGGRDISGQGRGIGLDLANTKEGAHTAVSGNIFARYTGGQFSAISLNSDVGTYAYMQAGINDLTLSNNVVYDWTSAVSVAPGLSSTASGAKGLHVTLVNNDFSHVTKDGFNTSALGTVKSVSTAYTDPNRTLSQYDASVGGSGSYSSFLSSARDNYKGAYNWGYTAQGAVDYIRAGFNKTATGKAPVAATTPAKSASPTSSTSPTSTTPTSTAAGSHSHAAATTTTTKSTRATAKAAARAAKVATRDAAKSARVAARVAAREAKKAAKSAKVGSKADKHDARTEARADRQSARVEAKAAKTDAREAKHEAKVEAKAAKAEARAEKREDRQSSRHAAKAPTVKGVRVHRRDGNVVVTVRFSENVGASINASDLQLVGSDGIAASFSVTNLTYDATGNAATFTVSGLATGRYRARLLSAGITDTSGTHLDGDRDRTGGGDYTGKTVKLKSAA